ncbi:MAG: hypothetical protein ACYSW8_27905 [Planctomycetota bacterium]|jgi:hypothetical protein
MKVYIVSSFEGMHEVCSTLSLALEVASELEENAGWHGEFEVQEWEVKDEEVDPSTHFVIVQNNCDPVMRLGTDGMVWREGRDNG